MKKYRQLAFRISAHAVVVTALMSVILAQDNPPQINYPDAISASAKQSDPLPMSEWAKTIPISNNQITLDFRIDNYRPITATQFEGGLIRVEKIGGGIYGFAPYISDQASGTISIKVFQINQIRNSSEIVGESIKELHTLIAGKAGDGALTSYSDSQLNFAIKVVDFYKSSRSVKTPDLMQTYDTQCCVSCDGLVTCACKVVTDCGECCRGKCCTSSNTSVQ